MPKSDWTIRENCHLVYSLFPMTTLLVEADHVVWVHAEPLAFDRTGITITTLVPKSSKPRGDAEIRHWQKNHEITTATLSEDFSLSESIQSGLVSGANSNLRFGRNESALHCLNKIIEEICAADA